LQSFSTTHLDLLIAHNAPCFQAKPSPQQLRRDRALENKRIAKEKIAITARHRVLAAILERVSVPMKKADLLTIAQH